MNYFLLRYGKVVFQAFFECSKYSKNVLGFTNILENISRTCSLLKPLQLPTTGKKLLSLGENFSIVFSCQSYWLSVEDIKKIHLGDDFIIVRYFVIFNSGY